MEASSNLRERSDSSIDERASTELVRLVKKLRCTGMEVEAKQVQIVLRAVDPRQRRHRLNLPTSPSRGFRRRLRW